MITENIVDLEIINQVGVNPKWLAFVEDEEARQIIDQIAIKDGLDPVCVQIGSMEKALAFVKNGVRPQLLILDLSKTQNPISAIKIFIASCPSTTRLIVFGSIDNISIYRELKQLGVSDYFSLPIVQDLLHNAMIQALANPPILETLQSTTKLRPFTVVMGVRGGVGATTLTINLASLMLSEFQQKACLIDFDFYFGNSCLYLDLVQNEGLNQALHEVERIDEVFIKRLLLHKEENFSLLAGQLPLDKDIEFPAEAVKALIFILRQKFNFIFADLPPLFNNTISYTILNLADYVIFVCDLSLKSVQDVLRLKSYINDVAPHIKYQIVVNSTHPANGRAINKEILEKAINSPIDVCLPFCKAGMIESVNSGQAFSKINSKHDYTKNICKLLFMLYPQLKKQKPETDWLSRLKFWKNKS